MEADLVSFYWGHGTDTTGRRINDIWKLDDEEFEWHHGFIQWLFPLPEASYYNPNAMILPPEVASVFQSDPMLQREVIYSFDFALRFCGFQRTESKITKGANLDERSEVWHWADSHHHLRLSRIVQSLHHLGLSGFAGRLKDTLIDI